MTLAVTEGPSNQASRSAWLTETTPRELTLLVYRQMRVFAGPHRDLEDLVQAALEQVLRAKYEPQVKLSSFTYVICYRVWLKHLRWTYRFRKRFSDVPADEENAHGIEAETPSSQLEARERFERLYAALGRVSPKRRAVVALYYLSGLEVAEITEVVESNEATVRSRLRDGRTTLRKILAADPYFATYFDESQPEQPESPQSPGTESP